MAVEAKEMLENNVKHAVRREIQTQLIKINIELKKEVNISEYVALLSEKRQLQELLNVYNNEH
jgi:hypothetical protein